MWREYWGCKSDPACRPTLCGAGHIKDARWLASGLSRREVGEPAAAQWQSPVWDAEAAAKGVGDALNSNAIRALQGGVGTDTPLDDIYRGCATPKGVRSHRSLAALLGCARSAWVKNVTAFITQARKVRPGKG